MSYVSAKEYQEVVVNALKEIFSDNVVKSEWDSVEYDGHTHNHILVYAPRVDVAIGPFNTYGDLDIGTDRTAVMRSHPLVKRLEERYDVIWNNLSRCFLAIEIVFSGTSKHIAGDFLNATATGSIGLIIAHRKIYKKVNRMLNYFTRLEDFERVSNKGLHNLMVFQDDSFLEFLWELKYPDKVAKLEIKNRYNIVFIDHLRPKIFSLFAHKTRHKPSLIQDSATRLLVYGFDVAEVTEQHDIVLSPTRYTHASTVDVYGIITSDNKPFKVMDIIDVAVQQKYRSKKIGTQILKIFEKIARENKCQFICVELGFDRPNEPIESQKRFFERNGFTVWFDKRAQFSGWVGKKSLQ